MDKEIQSFQFIFTGQQYLSLFYSVLHYPVFFSSTLSLHYPVLFFCYFVFVILCLPFHLLLCLYNTLSSITLSQ